MQQAEPLGVAVVGAGYWGPNLSRNFAASADWDLRWVCDRDRGRADAVAAANGAAAGDDLDAVLGDPDVAAVAIATPAATHTDLALAALAAGKHVLVEKPLASSYADAAKVVHQAQDSGLTLMADHTFCYTPAVQLLRRLIADGTLGDIQFYDSVRVNLGLVQPDVNVLWDLAPHDLSILDFVLPDGLRPVAVAAHGADPIGTGVECVGYLTLQLPGGAIAHVHVNWLSPVKVRTTMIGGSRRTVVYDDMNPAQRVSVFDRGVDRLPAERADLGQRIASQVSYRAGDMHAPALAGTEALAAMVGEFAAAVRDGRAPATDGHAALRVLDILEAASRSLEFKGAVVPLRTGRDA